MRWKKIVKINDDNDAAGPGPSTTANKSKLSPNKVIKRPAKGERGGKKVQDDPGDGENVADNEEEGDGGEQSSDVDEKYSPVTRAILEATADSDVTLDDDSSSEKEIIVDVKGKGKAA